VSPIVESATRDAEEIRRTAQSDSSEILDEATTRASDTKKAAREDAEKIVRDALRDAELIRSRAREEAETVLEKTRETIAEVRDEASRRKTRELADELESRLAELGNLDDVVETLRSRRREEDLDALAVDAASAQSSLPAPTASPVDVEAADATVDAAVVSTGEAVVDSSLRSSDELDDGLSPDQLTWAPTPPPGVSPEDFATPRKGLFRKKKS
jgi:vacuolar-type H+-ATPase subunit E/Vma4